MTRLFSTSLSGALAQIRSARVSSVRATATLRARGWWESKSRYRSEWVFFLKTVVVSEPSLLRITLVSRNGSDPSCSISTVNLMVGSIELRWAWNCFVYFYFIFFNCCILFIAPPMTHVATHAFSFPPIFPAHSHLTCPSPHRYISHHALYFITTDEDPRLGRNVW